MNEYVRKLLRDASRLHSQMLSTVADLEAFVAALAEVADYADEERTGVDEEGDHHR